MFSLIIPTFNEKDNIVRLIEKVQGVLEGYDYEIIVVDDRSPDGTATAVEMICKKDARIRLIVRESERGLSSAVLEGFKRARGEIFGVMDADLSHNPNVLREMIKIIMESYVNLVIASRRIAGGNEVYWPWYRKVASGIANTLAVWITGTSVTDSMSGYFCLSRSLYEENAKNLRPHGFKILLEFLVRARHKAIKELPYTFSNRNAGQSKLSFVVILQFIYQLIHLLLFRFGWFQVRN